MYACVTHRGERKRENGERKICSFLTNTIKVGYDKVIWESNNFAYFWEPNFLKESELASLRFFAFSVATGEKGKTSQNTEKRFCCDVSFSFTLFLSAVSSVCSPPFLYIHFESFVCTLAKWTHSLLFIKANTKRILFEREEHTHTHSHNINIHAYKYTRGKFSSKRSLHNI